MKKGNDPIFKSVFGKSWESLPSLMQKRYAISPFSDEKIVMNGKMDIVFGWFITLLCPILKLTGALVPYQGKDIPTTVHFLSNPENDDFILQREFHLANRAPFIFRSKMLAAGGNEVIEFMRFGVGWRCAFSYDGELITLKHRGYVWRVAGMNIPIPLALFLGRGYAEEQILSDNSFRMKMTITHPLFGKIYEYRGTFEVKG